MVAVVLRIFKWGNPAVKYIVGVFVLLFTLMLIRECRADYLVSAGYGTESGFLRVLDPKNFDRAYII